jgi:hypothetical protein
MTVFKPQKTDYVDVDTENGKRQVLKTMVFDSFNPTILGLGDVKKEATAVPAISAIFDLQGFTNFCKQIEPELSVPLFLSSFLDWIFDSVKQETKSKAHEAGVELWHELFVIS